jgi:hypothetical protein
MFPNNYFTNGYFPNGYFTHALATNIDLGLRAFDVTVKGYVLETFGLTDRNTIDGIGLNTFGFVWPCDNIWFQPYYSNLSLSISTTWTLAFSSTLTTWTLAPGWSVGTTWTPFSTEGEESCGEVDE